MIKIDCAICRDLMPLVWDGVAEAGSREAVEAHLAQCEDCRAMYEGGIPVTSSDQALLKTVKRVKTISSVAFCVLLLAGVVCCEMVMQFGSVFLLLAVVSVRGLLKITFRPGKGKWLIRALSLLAAALLLVGTAWGWNEVFGNPFTKAQAKSHIQGYLDGAFGDSDYYIEKVLYNWSGSYDGYIHSESDPELEFHISYRDGEILYDTYDEHVLDIWE